MKLRRIISNNWLFLKYRIKYTPAAFWAEMIYTVLVSFVWTITGPVTVKFVFDALTEGKSFKEIMTFLAVVSVLMIIRHIYACVVVEWLAPKAGEKLIAKVREELFIKACGMDLEYYETPQFYTDFVWAAANVESRLAAVYRSSLTLVARLSELIMMGGVMLALDPVLFVFAAVSVAVRVFLRRTAVRKRFELNEKAKPIERERDYSSRIFYLADYAKEIRLSKIHKPLYRRFNDACERMRDIYDKGGREVAKYSISYNILQVFIFNFAIYVYLAFKILVQKLLTVGDFSALATSTSRFANRAGAVVDVCIEMGEHSLYIEKFRKFLDYEPKIEGSRGTKKLPDEIKEITFKNVSFTYHGESKPSLLNINLTIHPYEKIAIVGYNGAGKSTLIKLLLRLYDVTEGEILLDGINIKEFDIDDYRKKFGAVFQDFQIFAATLGENTAMDYYDGTQKNRINDALLQAGFFKTENMPLGLDTPLTKEFHEEGTNLSGGEGQKVAISRVFYKPCQYAIMDEPSSALDPISEYELNQNMAQIAEDKTVIFISHRLSTTVMADCIYMMEKGRIIEKGPHHELMELGGKYAEMFNKQSEKYKTA